MVRKDSGKIMERNIEKELMEIKRDITSLRDKAVSAKAMMANAESQIKEHTANLSQLIDESSRPAFDAVVNKLLGDLTSAEATEELISWIESYTNKVFAENVVMIDKLKESIANWKAVTE